MQQYPMVTIVGGSGFVGRHTVKAFAQAGYRIRVLVRNTIAAEFLKPLATVGQIAIEHVDITRPETLVGKFAGSDIVVNLVSILYASGRQTFEAINVTGARAIAEEARKAGARSFVHLSALGADQGTDTQYGSTKLAGEQAVRAAFPQTVILRPSLIVGPEDRFFQRFGRLSMMFPVLPLIGGGHTKFQPLLVTDVAQAILLAATGAEAAGRTYALAGDQVYSFRELLQLLARITNRHPFLVTVPAGLARFKAFFLELLPFAPILTRDQVKLLSHDSVAVAGVPNLTELGFAPRPIADALPQLLVRYIKS